MRLLLILSFFSSLAFAQDKSKVEQLIEATNENCKASVKEIDNARITDFRAHVLRLTVDDIFYKLSLRERLIREGAIESQKYLDDDLFSRIYYNVEKMANNPEYSQNLKFIREQLDTQPLELEKGLSEKLNSKFISVGL
ncbi:MULTISPECIES: hypothetical protein [Pseudoalteromonas]|uniref:hypothetical protein n=1 Tax=Pseudoalteromonas TaxID=53246 RepID=UPI00026CC7D7|nr:hypothetical protein [Pseudoalteromonas spongiae]ATC98851.1 hypothetical protein PSPO_a1812 [Pseudoalteromonas spongiae UST010723-006]